MKKRVLALLLAGLITASMASCVSSGKKNDKNNTTAAQTTVAPGPDGTQTPADQLQDVNETVYAIVNNASLLTDTAATAAAAVVPQFTELRRVKYSATWSVVEYNGAQYYVASSALTTDDIMGKNFTPCTPTVMYATSGLKVRPYASLNDSYSKEVATLLTNDAVTVIATGTVGVMDWSKIKYTDANGAEHEYFVSSKYLSKTQVSGTIDKDYSQYFTDCEPKEMYVNVEVTAYVRSTPTIPEDNSNAKDSLVKNAKVYIVATGTGDYSTWSQIKYPDGDPTPGVPQTYAYGYIKTELLSAIPGGEVATLDTLLNAYGLEKIDPAKKMYVSLDPKTNEATTLNVRSTPDFAGNNIIGSINSKQEVTVVGKGTHNGTFCYIITLSEGGYGFVSGKYITADANGTPMLTLDAIVSEYQFQKIEAKDVYVKSDVSCRLNPDSAEGARTMVAGAKTTAVAKGTYKGAEWYIVEIEGIYYFAGVDFFTETPNVG